MESNENVKGNDKKVKCNFELKGREGQCDFHPHAGNPYHFLTKNCH